MARANCVTFRTAIPANPWVYRPDALESLRAQVRHQVSPDESAGSRHDHETILHDGLLPNGCRNRRDSLPARFRFPRPRGRGFARTPAAVSLRKFTLPDGKKWILAKGFEPSAFPASPGRARPAGAVAHLLVALSSWVGEEEMVGAIGFEPTAFPASPGRARPAGAVAHLLVALSS